MYTCKQCGQYLTYVYQYSRWYCPYCRRYLEESRKCSTCQRPLTYIPVYQKWFCYACYKYDEPKSAQTVTSQTAKTETKPETKQEIKASVEAQASSQATQANSLTNTQNNLPTSSTEKKESKKYPTIVSKEKSYIQALFLIYQDGRLIERLGKFGGSEGDILSSMLTAVQDFVKESFQTQGGGLSSLQYGKTSIALERGVHIYLAAVIVGDDEPAELRRDMRKSLITIREQYPWLLKTKWDGDLDKFMGTKRILAEQVWNKYCQETEQMDIKTLEKSQKEKGIEEIKSRADALIARLQNAKNSGQISQLAYEDAEGFVNMARRYIDSNNIATAEEYLQKAETTLSEHTNKKQLT